MISKLLLSLIIIPLLAALANFVIPRKLKEVVTLLASLATFVISFMLFGKESMVSLFDMGFGINLSFRLYHFSSFIVMAACGFTFLTTLYSIPFFRKHNNQVNFFSYLLLSLCLTVGAVLADNLVVLLFFWEGLLLTVFAMIAQSKGISAFRTAIKAFVIIGITDLCMMVGIAMVGNIAGTLTMSNINILPMGLAGVAFILLMIGAISKAGAMPFHTWIPDAAIDAPLPFMAYIPAALEKLLGIYFLARISLDLFVLQTNSGLSTLLMVLGIVTIVFAVMMALIQKDYKRLLSYHAVSQVGYMVLGIGTALPIGIVGGIFHMINHALYKSCLFFTAGSVERQTGTTDLAKLGGLRIKMPITFVCFLIAAASISGVPPFNGFFSKELIYDAALERGLIFYIAAIVGSFFTAASFLKLGHAAFFGKIEDKNKEVKEAPIPMLITMITIASLCVIFGIFNYLPLAKLIQPILGARLEGHNFYGWPHSTMLVAITVLVIIGAFINHITGVKLGGSGLKAAEHIHNFPGLHLIYNLSEKRFFDPYNIGIKFVKVLSLILWAIDRIINWFYDGVVVGIGRGASYVLRWLHNGSYVTYIIWSMLGTGALLVFITR